MKTHNLKFEMDDVDSSPAVSVSTKLNSGLDLDVEKSPAMSIFVYRLTA